MANRIKRTLNALAYQRVLRRWRRLAVAAETIELSRLRRWQARAIELRKHIERVIHVSEARLTLPLLGSNAMQPPLFSDWAWRPEVWSGPLAPSGQAEVPSGYVLGHEVKLFHDCRRSELILRQVRNTREQDLAPFGLRLEVFRFDGSFLSIAVDLPNAGSNGLGPEHLVHLQAVICTETPIEIYARLNIKHGPNVEQVVRQLDPDPEGTVQVDLDLGYTDLGTRAVERMWVDLIFDQPQMNSVQIRDLTFSRRPRADL